jgi:predicted Zn-dependent protease
MSKLVIRLVLGGLFAVFGLFNYFTAVSENPITGEVQRVKLSPQQEVVLGRQGRESVIAQYGGLDPNPTLQAYIEGVGERVVARSEAGESPYPFEFHLLRAPQTVNAFALPGGQIFLTTALLNRLDSEAQLAGVLGHEVGHVIARHGAEHLAKQRLGVMLVNAVGIAASDRPEQASQAALVAQVVNQLVQLKYGRDDELESDRLGMQFLVSAGYSPLGLVELMEILASVPSGAQPPEFLSTHPYPNSRITRLEELIAASFPTGIPPELEEEGRFPQIVPPRLP